MHRSVSVAAAAVAMVSAAVAAVVAVTAAVAAAAVSVTLAVPAVHCCGARIVDGTTTHQSTDGDGGT